MRAPKHRTKIVATIGPASSDRAVLRQMVIEGLNVARLNFSHGSYETHAQTIATLRSLSSELDTPISILQDLQGPKIRVGQFPEGAITLREGATVVLVSEAEAVTSPDQIYIDYPYLAEDAEPGTQILLDDGLLELRVTAIASPKVQCEVVRGGRLSSRKGVNLPTLSLNLPSMTEKDEADLEFGLSQGIDWVSLSFVRKAEDLYTLRTFLKERGSDVPIIAKIEKPQAVQDLEAILTVCDGVMVARGDMGVEVSPERVPMIQKHIIRRCNQRGIPVITATQMLESMIHNPRPTRAEASDVANAIVDGTDAVMLSGESAVGQFPIEAIRMMVRIAESVEQEVEFTNFPAADTNETHALSEALNAICGVLDLRCIVAFTSSGYSAQLAAAERSKVPVVAMTPNKPVYQRLNLVWGVLPVWIDKEVDTFEAVIHQAERCVLDLGVGQPGDRIVVMGGIPMGIAGGTNFLKIHRLQEADAR
jgi:pyruvate kinase